MLDSAMDSAIKTPGVSYEATICPWLGEEAAVALLPPAGHGLQFAVVADTTDAAAARTTLFGLARGKAKTTDGTYKGVSYLSDGSDAVAVDGNFALVGTLDAVERIDVQQGAPALSAAADFQASTAHELPGAVLDAFVRTRALIDMVVLSTNAIQSAATSSASTIPLTGSAITSQLPAATMAMLDKLIPANSTILASARLNRRASPSISRCRPKARPAPAHPTCSARCRAARGSCSPSTASERSWASSSRLRRR